jgi:hypothetical protein
MSLGQWRVASTVYIYLYIKTFLPPLRLDSITRKMLPQSTRLEDRDTLPILPAKENLREVEEYVAFFLSSFRGGWFLR